MKKVDIDGTDIFQILQTIENRPGLFILSRNLEFLYSFVSGYKFLAAAIEIEIKNLEKLDQFSAFLKHAFDENNENTMGWFGQLHSEFGSEQGFAKFFEYWHKFKEKNSY